MEGSGYVVVLILINVFVWLILSMIPQIKHKKTIFITFSFLSLWIFLAIREPYSDMYTYEKYFHSINLDHFENVFKNDWEILFKLLLYAIRFVTEDVRVVYWVIAFLTLIGPFMFIKRYSKNYLLSVLMFVAVGSFYMQFFILRQAIAISIFLLFFHFIGEKKLFKFCIGILLAALFHKTALVLLILYPLVNIRPSKFKNISVGVVTLLAIIFSSQISKLLMSGFYSEYTNRVSFGNGVALFLFYISMYLFYLMLERRKICDREKDEITKASLLTILFQFFTMQNNAFSRLGNYTRDSFCILIPNAIQKFDGKTKILFSMAVIFACIIFVIVTGTMDGYNFLQ